MATRLKTTKKLSTKELNRKLIGKDLHKVMMDWKNAINEYEKIKPIPTKLNTVLEDHFSNVMGIIRQHLINDESLSERAKSVGGQKNDLGREFFREEVSIHISKNTTTPFPTWKQFDRELEKFNETQIKSGLPEVKISSKAFDNYKDEWRKGTFNFPIK
jgi:hypothetical protein